MKTVQSVTTTVNLLLLLILSRASDLHHNHNGGGGGHGEEVSVAAAAAAPPPVVPQRWPDQFHSVLYMNLTDGRLQISNLWYDWVKGRNVNIIQKQLGELLYDVEWNNGTSFYYTLHPSDSECEVVDFGVGIPRPDWLLDGITYLGTQYTDGFLCNVWEKLEFIWYYEDVHTKVPVRWDFYDGISTHVMTYEVGAVLEDSVVQAPAYCFNNLQGSSKA